MLEIRPNCEHCNTNLPNNSPDAMICTFECTFCVDCATKIFNDFCPNCGGNFQKRPVRPEKYLDKHPPSSVRVYKPKPID